MTKLKTLKDLQMPVGVYIGCSMGKTQVVDYEMLRAEAVKWVKHYGYVTDLELRLFMDFFNLTEADLKEEKQ